MIFTDSNRRLGFGCMRLPMSGEVVDYDEFCRMVDAYMQRGFNYFDTAAVYIGGQSETALRDCLVKRYPRDSFVFVDKLSTHLFKTHDEILPLFERQLATTGLEYFDLYLMHAQNRANYEKFCACRAYETAFELKQQGRVKHVGLSFHDSADLLEEILTAYPQIEVVQLQLNYLDWDDPAIQAHLCYEVCVRHNKPVVVMEPVKGGSLANLPEDARRILDDLHGGSPASYAIRFAAGHKNVKMVLSGMSNFEQMQDNLSVMEAYRPLDAQELDAIERVCGVIRSKHLIACTACRYCVDGCPKHIAIPDLFACMNAKQMYRDWNADFYYGVHTKVNGKASACIGCGRCEKACPQHLEIRRLLANVAAEFEK